MCERGGELVAADEPTIIAKPLFDAIIVENGQSDECLADSASTNESEWGEVSCKTDDSLDKLVAPIEDPRCWRWYLSGRPRCKVRPRTPC